MDWRKNGKKVLIGIMVLVMILGTVKSVHAETSYNTKITVTYKQSSARKMVKKINELRTGNDAWCWNETNTKKVYYSNLKKYKYDYGLEKLAMKRAAEIAISFAHVRPNGTSCFTVFGKRQGARGENIAKGYLTMSSVFHAWAEADCYYEGQGHRRNMLNPNTKYVGIGHVKYKGVDYWVQLFSDKKISTKKTKAINAKRKVTISVAK